LPALVQTRIQTLVATINQIRPPPARFARRLTRSA
jgi:hypothetical protein